MSKFSVSCCAFRPLHRNTLRGFCEIRIDELRLTIRDIAVHQRSNARWVQLPAKPQVRDGELVTDNDGKIQYVHLMSFDNRAVSDAFSALEFAPAAFEKEGVP
jgi:hypothetical protein